MDYIYITTSFDMMEDAKAMLYMINKETNRLEEMRLVRADNDASYSDLLKEIRKFLRSKGFKKSKYVISDLSI